ncbi:hypothetical protein EVAR_91551_1 [Eumeta japonica]|uniref:Helitron helicase-like domain-containing protein n=1 Tax=Eumeta variegata TaxID=151549 RepID=A0A4C1T5H6_EUMVA|nr:hypothetical protein EVAR_91551_1 [Eumeta japonica]
MRCRRHSGRGTGGLRSRNKLAARLTRAVGSTWTCVRNLKFTLDNNSFNQRERQQTSRARSRNQVLAHSNRSAFRYDPQIDYAQQSSVQIGDMNKICPKCSAKKWVDETNGMCCASGKTAHPGRYNAPAVNEVAVLLVDEEKGPRDIVLHGRDGQLKRVSELHRSYDPLQYPLMFVKGEDGYYLTIPQEGSPRYLHEKIQDAMTYVRNYGRPDLFVTFTCNLNGLKLKRNYYLISDLSIVMTSFQGCFI